MVSIGEAGNTLYPSLYIILEKGYAVEIIETCLTDSASLTLFIAKKDDRQFIADNFLSLLGLISIWENLGNNLIEKINAGEQLKSEIVKYQIT